MHVTRVKLPHLGFVILSAAKNPLSDTRPAVHVAVLQAIAGMLQCPKVCAKMHTGYMYPLSRHLCRVTCSSLMV